MKSLQELLLLEIGKKDDDISFLVSSEMLKDVGAAAPRSGFKIAGFLRMAVIEKMTSRNPFIFDQLSFRYEGLPLTIPHSVKINASLKLEFNNFAKKNDLVFQQWARLSIAEKLVRESLRDE